MAHQYIQLITLAGKNGRLLFALNHPRTIQYPKKRKKLQIEKRRLRNIPEPFKEDGRL